MKPLLFLFSSLLFSHYSFAQDTTIVVNAGTKLNDLIPIKDQYYYNEFLNAKVFFRDGKVTEAKMNYNMLIDEMHFLRPGGDTLALDNEPTIKFISINNDTFYFDYGYILVIRNTDALKLGMRNGFRIIDKKKETAYELQSSSASVSSFSSYNDGKMSHQLTVKEQAIIIRITQYYFGDRYDHFVLATQQNLAELFPKCEQQLKMFRKKNRIDFTKRSDLEKAVSFLENTCR